MLSKVVICTPNHFDPCFLNWPPIVSIPFWNQFLNGWSWALFSMWLSLEPLTWTSRGPPFGDMNVNVSIWSLCWYFLLILMPVFLFDYHTSTSDIPIWTLVQLLKACVACFMMLMLMPPLSKRDCWSLVLLDKGYAYQCQSPCKTYLVSILKPFCWIFMPLAWESCTPFCTILSFGYIKLT